MNNFKIIFLSIFIISVFLKLLFINNYESSIDDNIVLQSILNQKNVTNLDKLKTKIYDTNKATYNSFGKKFLRRLDIKYNINNILYPLNNFIQFVIVPFKTTYSPFQYFFVPFLINSKYTISHNLFGGRFISFIFSVLTLIIYFRLLLKYFSHNLNFAITYILILFAFSHEFFIYSIHMSSYMAGLLAVILLTLLALKYIKESYIKNYKISFIFGILLGLLLLFQYQILYYIVPFLMTIIYLNWNKNYIKSIFYLLTGFAIIFIPIYLLFLSKHLNHVSDHWAHGAMLKYFYPNEIASNFYKFYYMLYFFISNFYLIIYNLISYTNYKFISFFLCLINIYFLFNGLYFLKNNTKYHILFVFIKFFSITYFILILSGKITFSPSRHSLILLPLIFLLIYLGISSINLKLNFSIFITIILFTIMLFSNIIYFNNHLEPYVSKNFKNLYLNNNNIISIDYIPFLIISNEKYKNIFYYNNDTSEISITNKSNFYKNKNISFISNKDKLNINVYNSYRYLYGSNDIINYKIQDSTLLYTKRSDEIHRDFILNDSIYFYNLIFINK